MTCWNFNIKLKFNNAMTFLLQPPPLNTAPNMSSWTAPTTIIAQWQQMSWNLTEGLKDGLKTQKHLEPSRYVYIYIYCGKYSIYYILCVQMETMRTNGHTSITYPCPANKWDSRHTTSWVPSFFFSFITKNTNDKQGTGLEMSTCLKPWYVFNLLLFLKFLLLLNNSLGMNYLKGTTTTRTTNGHHHHHTNHGWGKGRDNRGGRAQVRHVMSRAPWYGMFLFFFLYLFFIY